MKKYLLILSILFTLYSCKKESKKPSSSQVNQTLILGKWFYTSDTVKESTNGGQYKLLSTLSNYNNDSYMLFNNDGTGSILYNSLNSFTYTINNNIIMFNSGQRAFIRKITATNLSILYSDTTTNNGVVTIDYEAQYFSK